MNLDNLRTHLRREYWENRTWLFVLPLILSVLLIALSLLLAKYVTALGMGENELIIFQDEESNTQMLDFSFGATPLGQESEAIDQTAPVQTESFNRDFDTDFDESPLAMMAVYIASAWLVSFFYFAACLYTDRQDSSILFWKSMPVSERENVLAKLLFGVFGFTGAALLVGWLCWLVIFLLALVVPLGDVLLKELTAGGVFSALYQAPMLVLLGFVRGLPIIGLLMLVSAVAKRSPLMVIVVVLGVVMLSEKLLFSTTYIYHWLVWHLPIVPLDTESAQGSSLLLYHVKALLSQPLMLISGIVIGLLALAGATWFREHRFEI